MVVKKKKIEAALGRQQVLTQNSNEARELYNQSRFGIIIDERVKLSLLEGLYLMEAEKITIKDNLGKKINMDLFVKRASKMEPRFWIKYLVYKDMRNRGYIVKTALKFGADFRVYDRGVKPGEDHARWVVYPVHESETLTWQEWAAKNRVAHSTRKRLLIGVVDEENDVSYWEARWMRP
ncbi:MAG TPA: tRNA-intron lyase [Candidatus Nanoarchaeia archaeon]|nr:tRNA-intron lyase [Candidatus Nanoarchaeia archaeon]